jgi:adenylate cyclase
MSGDSKQEYLADGITENIISALSQVPNLFVIARNSTFTYKGKAVKVQQVAEDLGVRYVLEGSVQKSGGTLRISTQLIDAMTGHHVWSERYDREMKEIFALQDDITMKVINALQVKLTEGDRARPLAKGTENLEAYLKLLQALEFTARGTGTKEGNAQSQRLLEEVMVLDPKLPQVYEYLAATHFDDVLLGWSKSPEESIKLAFELTKKAIALDESRDHPYSVLGGLYVITRQYDKAVAECEKAVALAPNSAVAHHWLGAVLMIAGKYEEAIRHSEQALRLDPFARANSYQVLGAEYFHAGRYEEAIIALKKSLHLSPDSLALHIALTSAYSWAGRHEEARAQTAEVLRIDPNFSVEERGKLFPDKNRAAVERILEGLRKAGLK